METKTLTVQEISEANVAGYGRYIRTGQQDAAATLEAFSFWNKLAILDHASTSIGLVQVHKQDEAISTIFEQHTKTTEMLLPTTDDIVLVLAKPDEADQKKIDLETVVALRLPAGDAIVLDKATWHFAPHALRGTVNVWVIFQEDTPDNDMFVRNVADENGIRFLVEGM